MSARLCNCSNCACTSTPAHVQFLDCDARHTFESARLLWPIIALYFLSLNLAINCRASTKDMSQPRLIWHFEFTTVGCNHFQWVHVDLDSGIAKGGSRRSDWANGSSKMLNAGSRGLVLFVCVCYLFYVRRVAMDLLWIFCNNRSLFWQSYRYLRNQPNASLRWQMWHRWPASLCFQIGTAKPSCSCWHL